MLVAGGENYDANLCIEPLACAELSDPSTGAWTLTGSLNQARAYQTAVLLQNGDVLVAGGVYNVYNPTYTAEYYTP